MAYKCLDCKDTCVYVGFDETKREPCRSCCPHGFIGFGDNRFPLGPPVSGEFVSVPEAAPNEAPKTPITTAELAHALSLAQSAKGEDLSEFLSTRRLVFGKTVDKPTLAGTEAYVRSMLMALPGVMSVQLIDNGLQLEAVVDGGDDYAIAKTLLGAILLTTSTVGTTAVVVPWYGGATEVRFSRPGR